MFNKLFVTSSLKTKKSLKMAKYLPKSKKAFQNRLNFIFNKIENPIFFLMFDIGIKIIRFSLIKILHSYKKIS